MYVERYVDEVGLWALVLTPRCPWCDRVAPHRHLIGWDPTIDPRTVVLALP